jgi:large subunit ribosomal protein L29
MPMLRPSEIRDMTLEEQQSEIKKLNTELLNARSANHAGGSSDNPGLVRELRRTIARIKTIQNQQNDSTEDSS